MPVSSSVNTVGPSSSDAEFTDPRLIGACQSKSSLVCCRYDAHRSCPPAPPERVLPKNIQWPSRENVGTRSLPLLLTTDPRLTGAPQGLSRLSRCDTQMSSPPWPPGRLLVM